MVEGGLRNSGDEIERQAAEQHMAYPGGKEGWQGATFAKGNADSKGDIKNETDAEAQTNGREGDRTSPDDNRRWDP